MFRLGDTVDSQQVDHLFNRPDMVLTPAFMAGVDRNV